MKSAKLLAGTQSIQEVQFSPALLSPASNSELDRKQGSLEWTDCIDITSPCLHPGFRAFLLLKREEILNEERLSPDIIPPPVLETDMGINVKAPIRILKNARKYHLEQLPLPSESSFTCSIDAMMERMRERGLVNWYERMSVHGSSAWPTQGNMKKILDTFFSNNTRIPPDLVACLKENLGLYSPHYLDVDTSFEMNYAVKSQQDCIKNHFLEILMEFARQADLTLTAEEIAKSYLTNYSIITGKQEQQVSYILSLGQKERSWDIRFDYNKGGYQFSKGCLKYELYNKKGVLQADDSKEGMVVKLESACSLHPFICILHILSRLAYLVDESGMNIGFLPNLVKVRTEGWITSQNLTEAACTLFFNDQAKAWDRLEKAIRLCPNRIYRLAYTLNLVDSMQHCAFGTEGKALLKGIIQLANFIDSSDDQSPSAYYDLLSKHPFEGVNFIKLTYFFKYIGRRGAEGESKGRDLLSLQDGMPAILVNEPGELIGFTFSIEIGKWVEMVLTHLIHEDSIRNLYTSKMNGKLDISLSDAAAAELDALIPQDCDSLIEKLVDSQRPLLCDIAIRLMVCMKIKKAAPEQSLALRAIAPAAQLWSGAGLTNLLTWISPLLPQISRLSLEMLENPASLYSQIGRTANSQLLSSLEKWIEKDKKWWKNNNIGLQQALEALIEGTCQVSPCLAFERLKRHADLLEDQILKILTFRLGHALLDRKMMLSSTQLASLQGIWETLSQIFKKRNLAAILQPLASSLSEVGFITILGQEQKYRVLKQRLDQCRIYTEKDFIEICKFIYESKKFISEKQFYDAKMASLALAEYFRLPAKFLAVFSILYEHDEQALACYALGKGFDLAKKLTGQSKNDFIKHFKEKTSQLVKKTFIGNSWLYIESLLKDLLFDGQIEEAEKVCTWALREKPFWEAIQEIPEVMQSFLDLKTSAHKQKIRRVKETIRNTFDIQTEIRISKIEQACGQQEAVPSAIAPEKTISIASYDSLKTFAPSVRNNRIVLRQKKQKETRNAMHDSKISGTLWKCMSIALKVLLPFALIFTPAIALFAASSWYNAPPAPIASLPTSAAAPSLKPNIEITTISVNKIPFHPPRIDPKTKWDSRRLVIEQTERSYPGPVEFIWHSPFKTHDVRVLHHLQRCLEAVKHCGEDFCIQKCGAPEIGYIKRTDNLCEIQRRINQYLEGLQAIIQNEADRRDGKDSRDKKDGRDSMDIKDSRDGKD